MTVETKANRLAMLSDFGVDITKESGVVIKGIFDTPHNPIDLGEMAFSMQESYVLVESTDITDVGQGSTLTISGSDYVVTDLQPDGTGMTQVMLEKQ